VSHPTTPSALAVVPSPPLALAARLHHRLLQARDGDRGQGTVEYVALAMLIAAVMAGVVLASAKLQGGGIANVVVEKVKAAIGAAGTVPKQSGR
jgi:hypothetical protein